MATPRWEIMARSGPEDTLQPVQLSTNSSSQMTAGNDWAVGRVAPAKPLFYTDEAEAQRFTTQLESGGAASKVLRDLASARHVCAQPSYALEVRARRPAAPPYRGGSPSPSPPPRRSTPAPHLQLCKRSFREHQLKQCSPAYVEVLRCHVKM